MEPRTPLLLQHRRPPQQYHQQHQYHSVNVSSAPFHPPYHHRDGKMPPTSDGRWGRAQSSSSSWAAPNHDGGGWRGGRGRGGSTSSFFASRGRNNWRGGRGGKGGEGAGRGVGGAVENQYQNEDVSTSCAVTATTTVSAPDPAAVERVKCVLEQMHLVAPFLSPAEVLRMTGVLRSWTRSYREVTRELRVGEPPSGHLWPLDLSSQPFVILDESRNIACDSLSLCV